MQQTGNENTPLSLLIIDDDEALRRSLALNLELHGYQVHAAATAQAGFDALRSGRFQIVLCDLLMPETDGLSVIEKCRRLNDEAAVVLMTGFGDPDLALKAMRAGAYDYLAKPFSIDELVFMLRKIEEREKLKAENAELKSVISQRYNFSNIVAQSKCMKDIFETVKRLANFNTTVLIVGESGTGKELLARAIHHNSPRRGKPFVAINCGAIPETLMESELFGHRKGSFTDAIRDKIGLFEEASGGTIFLDEIGELPLHLQVKLLRALQEQQIRRVGDEQLIDIDVRVVAATLRNLEEDVDSGRFRDDLYYRLNVVSITIPPLRDRPEDIPALIEHFMRKHNKRLGLRVKKLESEALKCLMRYNWRGNVRELENCVERALVMTESGSIDLASLPEHIANCPAPRSGSAAREAIPSDCLSIKQRSRALEIELILKALQKTKGNRTHAARVLEISHRALLYKIKEYELGDTEKQLPEAELRELDGADPAEAGR